MRTIREIKQDLTEVEASIAFMVRTGATLRLNNDGSMTEASELAYLRDSLKSELIKVLERHNSELAATLNSGKVA